VDNVLDRYEAELNPERPRFFYTGIRLRYQAAPTSDDGRWRDSFEQGLPLDRMRLRD
jgi:hypothetical protein